MGLVVLKSAPLSLASGRTATLPALLSVAPKLGVVSKKILRDSNSARQDDTGYLALGGANKTGPLIACLPTHWLK